METDINMKYVKTDEEKVLQKMLRHRRSKNIKMNKNIQGNREKSYNINIYKIKQIYINIYIGLK